jgi:hypothetical protein
MPKAKERISYVHLCCSPDDSRLHPTPPHAANVV